MSTFTDGVAPSVNPGPEDGPDSRGRDGDHCESDADESTDSGSLWLREEIQRQMAAGRSGSGGRHARRNAVDPSDAAGSPGAAGYVPRHSVATPGPGAPPPRPGAGSVWPRPEDLPRRRPGSAAAQAPPTGSDAWSGPRQPDSDGRDARERDANGRDTSSPAPASPAVAPTQRLVPAGPSKAGSSAVEPAAALRPTGDPLFTAHTPVVGRPAQRGWDQLRGARFPRPDDTPQSQRVRVVLAERKGVARPVRTVVDIQQDTGVGELLRSNLIGSQLAVALRFAVGGGLALGVLPLLFALFPEIGRFDVFGLRLPWLLLGVLVYPFLLGLGFWHTRTAERVEQNFADHVQD